MANIIDYLDWFGDFSFETVPFGEADNLVLADLCYLDLLGDVPAVPPSDFRGGAQAAPRRFAQCSVSVEEAAASFLHRHPDGKPDDMGPLISPLTVRPLLDMATCGRRFQDVRLGCYARVFDEPAHEQFGALTAQLPDGSFYVAFQGTDDTLVGWLEDCEMSYKVVAAQADALLYLRRVAAMTEGPLRVGGHSKGGNLAAYAAAFCGPDVQDRIVEVWCNDSPGFVDEVVPLSSFEPIASRIRLFTPEYSVVGALFDHVVEPQVVKSAGTGVMEHSAIEWQIMRDRFVRGEGVSEGSVRVGGVFDRLIGSHDLAGRKRLLDGLYAGLSDLGVTRISQLFDDGVVGISRILGSVNSLEPAERQAMTEFLTGIMKSSLADAIEPVTRQLGGAVESAREEMARAIDGAWAQTQQAGRKAMDDVAEKTREGIAKALSGIKAPHRPEDGGAHGDSGAAGSDD